MSPPKVAKMTDVVAAFEAATGKPAVKTTLLTTHALEALTVPTADGQFVLVFCIPSRDCELTLEQMSQLADGFDAAASDFRGIVTEIARAERSRLS